jgi:hypothetical protein
LGGSVRANLFKSLGTSAISVGNHQEREFRFPFWVVKANGAREEPQISSARYL